MSRTQSIKISQAVPNDAKEMVAVAKTTWLATYPNKKYGITRADIVARFADKGKRIARWRKSIRENTRSRRFWVAKNKDRVVGFCGANKIKGRHEIGVIYILPKFQSRGIGRELVSLAFEWLGEKKDVYVCVASYNKRTIKFYKKMGFVFYRDIKKLKAHNLPSGKYFPETEMVKKAT